MFCRTKVENRLRQNREDQMSISTRVIFWLFFEFCQSKSFVGQKKFC